MKLEYLRLKNFIGIQVGMGISEIAIPFNEGNNRVCMILGSNGSGKSTILDNAVPQPYTTGNDRAKIIIEGLDGEKELHYLRGTPERPVMYKILIQYKWNASSKSHSTKAFITRKDGVDEIELNPNGNVTSYKEILDVEFMLDPSFLRLCKLSQESVNITKMKATERKQVVSSLLSEVEVYAEHNKKIGDKCNFISNTIKTIASKIDKLGDIEGAESRLAMIELRIEEATQNAKHYNNEISKCNGKLETLDVAGAKQAYSDLTNVTVDMGKAQKKLDQLLDLIPEKLDCSTLDKVFNHSGIVQNKLTTIKTKNALLIEEIKEIRFKLECSMEELAVQTNKLKDVENGYNISDLEKSIEIYENELESIDSKLEGITEFYDSDVLMKSQDQILMINASINHALTNTPASALDAIASAFERNSLMGYRASCVKKFEIAKAVEGSLFYKKIPAANTKLGELRAKVELKANLKKRPGNCTIDSCAFIKEALSIGNVEAELSKAETEYVELLKKYEDAKRNVEDIDATVKVIDSFSFIYKTIQSNRFTFDKLPNSWAYGIKAYAERIRTGIVSDEYEDLSGYITVASLNDRHRDIVENIIPTIGNELKLARQTNEMIKIISSEVDRINSNIKEYETKIYDSNKVLIDYEQQITDLTELSQLLSLLSEYTITVDNLEKEYEVKKSEYAKYTLIENEINELNATIKENQVLAHSHERMVKDLNRDRDTLNYQVQLYNEYIDEKDKFEKAYVNYEHIRYGLANKNGIPLVFIKIYLESTRLMCNRILEQLFHGEYKLLPFNITHNEFNIPCEVRGEVVADVSAMSGGERAILAIMLSLTLMQQSSSEGSYNIIHLDEMDAVLDSSNRLAFIQVLEELMNLFRIDQVIAISHNVGFESYPVDLVLLRDAKLENTDNKTVIYSLK